MNAGNIVNMIIRLVMRRLIGKGINAGIDAVGSRMSRGKPDGASPAPGQGSAQARNLGKRARQAMRLARRLR